MYTVNFRMLVPKLQHDMYVHGFAKIKVCLEQHLTHDSPLNFDLTLGALRLDKSGSKFNVESQVECCLQSPIAYGSTLEERERERASSTYIHLIFKLLVPKP